MTMANLDFLEQRLSDLEFEAPDPGRMTTRVLSQARRPRPSRLPRVLATALGIVVIAASVLYFVPAADAALAGAPIAGDWLRDAGLVGASGRITSVGSVATSSGYRLELVDAYADSARTVLLVHAEPAIGLDGSGPVLKDQFGRSYQWTSGSANAQTGNVIMEFEPLAWPDALTGARITLEWGSVQPYSCGGQAYDGSVCKDVGGSWILPAIIGVDEGVALPLPAPGRIGNGTYTFTSVRATPATIEIDIEITGVTMTDLGQMVSGGGGKPTPRFSVDLAAPNGDSADGGLAETEDFGGVHLRFTGYRTGPGQYRFHVSYLGEGEFARVLSVP